MSNFLDDVWRKWASTCDGTQECGDFVSVVGTAVSKEQDSGLGLRCSSAVGLRFAVTVVAEADSTVVHEGLRRALSQSVRARMYSSLSRSVPVFREEFRDRD